jgi:hypothetical protein
MNAILKNVMNVVTFSSISYVNPRAGLLLHSKIRCYTQLILVNNVGASVAKCLMSLTSVYFPLTAVGSNPDRDFGFFHASLWKVGGSIQVPVRA